VHQFDVERSQPFFDEGFEVVRQRRLLNLVLPLQQIEGIGPVGGNLFADGGWRSDRDRG
jgi:hypothetical protein